MKRKVLVSSLLSILMSLGVVVGGTFAVFTSEAETNIAISSGKVEVVAEVTDLKTYSRDVEQSAGTFANGGTAKYENGVVSLSLITPGDKAEFTITIKNNSNIATQYRSVLQVLDGEELFKGLTVTFDGVEFSGRTYATSWAPAVSGELLKTKVSVELPYGAGNEYQNLETSFALSVHAIQDNGDYLDGFSSVFAYTKEEVLAGLEAGADVTLMNDIVIDENLGAYDGASIDTNGYSLANSNGTLELNVAKDASFALTGITAPLTVSGEGTLIVKNAKIVAANDTQSAITLADNYAGQLVLRGKNNLVGAKGGHGIYVPATATLDLSGTGSVNAIGNNGVEYAEDAEQYSTTTDSSYNKFGGHGIGGEGNINIHDLASLSAEGYGLHAFGIGGNVADINIKNTNITLVRGGFLNRTGEYEDAKYTKSEPEGGAAIGSKYFGANILLDNVNITEAYGGSKSAGIGAFFHTAVNITIKNSTIDKVVGGVSAAGIGGSRVGKNNPSEQDININISDSVITAFGGYYGAGIGSGYDTHCTTPDSFPITTINISGNSVITAFGGKYAAGVGTGYHAGGLAGTITESVEVNAVSGEKVYKSTYTLAQDIGFGVIDPTRDGLNNTCSLNYKGTSITLPEVQ